MAQISLDWRNVELLPVKNDYVFYHLFGKRSHKRVLICLLSSILDGNPYIQDIDLAPTEYKKVIVTASLFVWIFWLFLMTALLLIWRSSASTRAT